MQIKEISMHTRREMLSRSAQVAGMLAGLGLLPGVARSQVARM